ncbi:hypothetical protein TSUD_396540 [Trifolium subterraneum]|uniref:Endonuclease/exonuclease/phosphatase domain-containing protein n=1 Tax=Trifolium subterraneum TaxID=3900 RepID=A0A2Z6NS83_TRISU|nr:hypothetical protein TSUD_396540 [Trifolium subterraneum]
MHPTTNTRPNDLVCPLVPASELPLAQADTTTQVREFVIHKSFNVSLHPLKPLILKEVIWQPPIPQWIKCNTDGGSNTSTSSCGGIFRNHNADFLCAFVENTETNSTLVVMAFKSSALLPWDLVLVHNFCDAVQKWEGSASVNPITKTQETKLKFVDEGLCHFLLGNAVFSFCGPGFVGVCLEWGVARSRCFVVNVYSKCSFAEKRILWSNLVNHRRNLLGDVWCVVGDFNAVLDPSERRGGVGQSAMRIDREMREFGEFISLMNLLDLPLLGRRFTWFQPNGGAVSRLDRFLVSKGWLDAWGESWGQETPMGWMAFMLTQKLKTLKGDLKRWNKEVFGDIELKIELEIESIKNFDLKAEAGQLSLEDDRARKLCQESMWKLLRFKETQIFQRSRSRWLQEGDANTNFFHNSVRQRRRRNLILALRVENRWVESVLEEVLMGGTGCNKGIAWVSWSNICKPKKEGGLGIRDLRLVNNALLAKWRWRILTKGLGLWRDIILARYGSLFPAPHLAGRPNGRIGNGTSTSFWFDPWVDGVPLRTRYQSLFQASDQCLDRVADMGSWVTGEWEWELRWKTDLDMQGQDLLNDLMESLRQGLGFLGRVQSDCLFVATTSG